MKLSKDEILMALIAAKKKKEKELAEAQARAQAIKEKAIMLEKKAKENLEKANRKIAAKTKKAKNHVIFVAGEEFLKKCNLLDSLNKAESFNDIDNLLLEVKKKIDLVPC